LATSPKSILITGVSTGIGAATARHFLRLGWRVYGTVRKESDAGNLVSTGCGLFTPVLLDITDFPQISRACDEVSTSLGDDPLDVICNNAGTSVPAVTVHQSVNGFQTAVQLNLVAPFAVTQGFYPLLRKPGGRIIFVGSLAGTDPLPFCAAYSASKHGIEALSGSLGIELALHGVKSIVVAPGSTKTALGDKVSSDTPIEGMESEFGPALARMASHMAEHASGAFSPGRVASVIERAAISKNPKSRYIITPGYIDNWLMPRLLGRTWRDRRWIRRLFPLKQENTGGFEDRIKDTQD
jgi:NAD(P)-dependent dehydrogenase (short-subunit alcohol dehydrogenase family)